MKERILSNSKIFRMPIETKTFVQTTISTIDNSSSEIVLPIHQDLKQIVRLEKEISEIIKLKTDLRKRCVKILEEDI